MKKFISSLMEFLSGITEVRVARTESSLVVVLDHNEMTSIVEMSLLKNSAGKDVWTQTYTVTEK